MRSAAFLVALFLAITGCKSSGESDLDGQIGATPGQPGNDAGNDDPDNCASAAAKNEQQARAYYESDVYPVLRGDCLACHVQKGDAGKTSFVLTGDVAGDYALVKALTEREIAGYPYLLAKATAIAGHTAGVRFDLDSMEADVIRHFSDLLKGKIEEPQKCVDEDDDGGDGGNDDNNEEPVEDDFLKGVTLLDNERTLSKAAMIMLGRRPTPEELEAVADGTLESLRSTLRGMMQGPAFTDFLMTGANDQLLTNMFADGRSLILMESDTSYYRFSAVDWPGIMPAADAVQDPLYNNSLAVEPLALIAYIVNNERDYREVLLADYTVFNSYTYKFFDSMRDGYVRLFDPETGVPAPPPTSPDHWVAGRFSPGVGTGYYVDGSGSRHPETIAYPHTGVLTTFPWLARWQSTETNGQRKRAKMVMSQFLGYDIEKMGSRPMEDKALGDSDYPTFKNPQCTSCHYQLDPLAGTFQNWGDHGRFRLNDLHYRATETYLREDALSKSYKSKTRQRCGGLLGVGGYCDGDLWYADRFPTGFVQNGANYISLMPDDGPGRHGPHDNATLRWAAEQLTNDSRFAIAVVKFWYGALFNAKPLDPPMEADPDYDAKVIAYIAQGRYLNNTAQVFTRDNGNGQYNLKDMLVEMVVSPWFRANTTSVHDRKAELAQVGLGVLLTPEQLERKMRSTLGIGWGDALTEDYNVMYGGIDSESVIERSRQINPLMVNVIRRMVSEMACEVIYNDFIADRPDGVPASQDQMIARPRDERTLFVEYDGESVNDEYAIKRVLADLHRQLWGNQAAPNSTEVERSYALFKNFWKFESEQNNEEMRCMSNPDREVIPLNAESGEPAYTAVSMRVWRDMIAYFISSPLFLYE